MVAQIISIPIFIIPATNNTINLGFESYQLVIDVSIIAEEQIWCKGVLAAMQAVALSGKIRQCLMHA